MAMRQRSQDRGTCSCLAMTTSRSVSKSSSMFSLPRRSSLGASSPSPSPLPPPPSPASPLPPTAGMTATSPHASHGGPTSMADDEDAGGATSTRRKSNNDKILRLSLASQPQSPQAPKRDESTTSPRSITTAATTSALPPQPRKLVRSPTADNVHHQQQRQNNRNFALTVSPTSPLPHENCSSLRDQFLKIKERFSAPSPVGSSSVSPTSSASTAPSSLSPSSARGASPGDLLEEDDKSGDRRASSSSAMLMVSVPTERLLMELNERTKKSYAGDLLWPNHAHVERWYVEDNYFKGSMTCWSMEKGAEVIARIARVISSRTSPSTAATPSTPTAASPTSGASNASRFNPDVSLQWIGRQLWAVTVSLPLTRSGELTSEHASIAQAIDDAIAEEVKKAPQECGPRAPANIAAVPVSPSAPVSPVSPGTLATPANCSTLDMRLNPLLETLEEQPSSPTSEASHRRVATLPLDPATSLAGEAAAAAASQDAESIRPASVVEEASTAEVDSSIDRRAVASDSSVSTVLAEEDHHHHEDECTTTRSQAAHEESDTVSALPLSLSMLSFTSLQSATSSSPADGPPFSGYSGSGSDHLHLHNGCAKDDDASHRVPPDKTGWLKKKNGLNSWQPRYFELKGNRLFYFASESEGIPRGAIVLDHAHVLRGKGDQSMTFTICASSGAQNLQMIKFSTRMTSQVHPRKSCVLRVVQESEETISAWITALNRASFYCHLSTNSSASGSSGSVTQSSSSTASSSSPNRKKKSPFYRLRSPSSSASSVDDDNRNSNHSQPSSVSNLQGTIDSASYHHYGSVKYLQDTDPLLWEIHPHDQQKIRKKATLARTRSDYLSILSKYSSTFRQIFLPRPRPITIEQTLRDILPELFLINNVLYGGGDENNGLENIFEVLDGCIKKFASAQEERVRAVSALLQACARTISGGDSYFVVHSLLGNPFMIIRPAEARGHPIEIDVSVTNPSQFCITVFSAFSFHHIEDVENYGDSGNSGAGGGNSMPEPLLRVQTFHVQEFDFANGKSTRWLRIRTDGMKEDHDGGGGSGMGSGGGVAAGSAGHRGGSWMSKRSPSETGFGALLDALS